MNLAQLDSPPFALNQGFGRVLQRSHWHAHHVETFGPAGLRLTLIDTGNGQRGALIVTQAPATDEVDWLHASVSWSDVMPSYDDLVLLHRAVFGRARWAYEVHAPQREHVNIHPNARHLFGRADGKPVLPDFTMGTGSI